MFKQAKLKLTLQYLLIIMAVSVFLSALIYQGVNSITSRALHMQTERMERRWEGAPQRPMHKPIFEEETLIEIQKNLISTLFKINIYILVGSFVAGYYLASRTLKPIEDMMDEQKRFISDASHELKTPITALKTELEVSLKDKNQDKKALFKQLRSNLEEVNKLQKLTESLLKE
ncbi:histidine kinase dimerization/phospho-acceptor domain-containing protein, partial [Patescibacteria group bacterium]